MYLLQPGPEAANGRFRKSLRSAGLWLEEVERNLLDALDQPLRV